MTTLLPPRLPLLPPPPGFFRSPPFGTRPDAGKLQRLGFGSHSRIATPSRVVRPCILSMVPFFQVCRVFVRSFATAVVGACAVTLATAARVG